MTADTIAGVSLIDQLAAISCAPERWPRSEQVLTGCQLARRRERQREFQKGSGQKDFEAESSPLLKLVRRQAAQQQALEQLLRAHGFDPGENLGALGLNTTSESPNKKSTPSRCLKRHLEGI